MSILEFPRYPSTGNITYRRTVDLRPRTLRFLRRDLASIVVHGIDYDGNGEYDDTLGGSDLNPRLQGEATAPALCGELVAGGGERARVYKASLTLPAAGPGSICHLRPAT